MTYTVNRCIGCGARDLTYRPAIIAPFVAAYVFHRATEVCRIAQCRVCGLAFFEDRFDESEAAALYADYRSKAYYEIRHQWEPWYTRSFNRELGGAKEIAFRRDVYCRIIRDHVEEQRIERVLDYGGDRGQLMTGGPGKAHFVFDISGVDPEPGVARIPDATTLADQTFDLVLLCEVLEHLSDPVSGVENVLRHVAPGGLLYITIPNREFRVSDIPAGSWYRRYLSLILKHWWSTLVVDFWSAAVRIKFARIPPLGFAKMHEHVTFFDARSLTMLLERVGLQVVTCESYRAGRGLAALCQKPGAKS